MGAFFIELRRCLDDTTYRYEPACLRNGRPAWRRADSEIYLQWSPRSGWVICDPGGTVLGRPWDVEKDEQDMLPPAGPWVSRKGDKSFVYEYRAVADSP